jgi:acyl-CoA thioesterase I
MAMDRLGGVIRFCVMLILAGLLNGCDNQEVSSMVPEPVSAPEKEWQGMIVALGDSLTAGLGVELQHSYPALLQKKLEEDGYLFEVVNAGVSGETSSGTLSRLNWILSRDPDIVIVEIGANDGLRGIETDLVEKNIEQIILTLRDKEVVTVLAGMQMVWNLGEDYTERFSALYGKLAAKYDLVYMPFFLEDVATVASLNRADGIHPNEQGYEIIAANIYPYVLEAIQRLEEKRQAGNR